MGAYMEFNSIAMIETNGLVSAITALDVMLKLGKIKFLGKEVISNGCVTISVEGNIPELSRILQAGRIAANSVGAVISSNIIENPDKLIYDMILDKKANHSIKIPKLQKKIKRSETEKIITLFDDVDKLKSSILSDAPQILVEESEKDFKDNVFFDAPKSELFDSEKEEDSENELLESEKAEDYKIELLKSEKEEDSEIELLDSGKEEDSEIEEIPPQTLNHLERLRQEAKLEIEREIKKTIQPDIKQNEEINTKNFSEMNVHELRKLARTNVNFPIKGREISKANRSKLINYFNEIS